MAFMTDTRDTTQSARSLNEIKQLEEKLVELKRRLLDSGAPAATESVSEDETASFLIVGALGRRYAVPVGSVEEVVEMAAPIPMDASLPGVIGLLNYHGDYIALFDFAQIARRGVNPATEEHVVVICTIEETRFGIMVDEAMDVVTVDNAEIRITDEVFSGLMRELAILPFGDDTVAVVDLWSAVVSLPLRIFEDASRALSSAGSDRSGVSP